MVEFYGHRNGSVVVESPIALIAVGANLPLASGLSPIETCRRALVCVDRFPYANLCGLSRWFVSTPVPASDQPDYINAVAALRVDRAILDDPACLLRDLQAVETRFGRVRSGVNAARTLDLDIIAVGERVRSAPDPILPHPRAHLRAFVLLPLRDVAPTWTHPLLGRSVGALLADLPAQPIRPVDS
jgi:2-amino-4-hydroxy-6-hydroxymethyldihydropteridine diphosphokinase